MIRIITLLFGFMLLSANSVAETKTYRLTDFYGEGIARMQGKAASTDIAIPLSPNSLVVRSTLTLNVVSSQALIKKRSQLFVRFNNATIGQIAYDPDRPSLTSDVVIPTELWRPGFNQLTLAVSQHYANQCVDGSAPELWSEINVYNSTLSIETNKAIETLALRDLSGFFHPGIGGQRNVEIYSDIDDASITKEKTLSLVAQALALRNQYQPLAIDALPLPNEHVLPDVALAFGASDEGLSTFWSESNIESYETSSWYRDERNANVHVLVGTEQSLSMLLTDDVINDINGPFLHVERTPAFRVKGETLVQPAYRLIVSGDTPEQVYEAARSLALQDDALNATNNLIVNSQSNALADIIQVTQVVSPDEHYTFEDLGFTSERFRDEGDFNKRMTLRLPADFYVPENASVKFLLDFGYGAGYGPGSIMNVSVNDELVHGLYLGNTNGEAFRDYELNIPARFFRGGINNIDFSVTMRAPLAGVECDDVFGSHLIFQLNNTSSLTLPKAGHVAIQPDLRLLGETGYPFARYASAPRSHIVLPSNDFLSAALTLAGKFAQSARAPLLNLDVIMQSTIPENGTSFLLGTPDTLSKVEQESFASAIGETNRWPYRLQNTLYNRVRNIASDKSFKQMRADGVTIQTNELGPLAVLIAEKSPHNSKTDTVFLMAAQTPELLTERVHDLVSLSMWGQLAGDFFVWDNALTPSLVMQVNDKFEMGEANSRWLTLRLWLSNHPWYWLVGFLFSVFMLSLIIYLLLKRRNKEVQASWD